MAFSEHGVLMLSSVLNSPKAIQVNIQIMRIFSRIRQMLFDTTEIRLVIEEIIKRADKQDKSIELIFQYVDEIMQKKETQSPRTAIGYKF